MPKTFKYVGPSGALIFRGETLTKDKPFSTDNNILIAALKARESNVGDVKEVKEKPVETKDVTGEKTEKKSPKKDD